MKSRPKLERDLRTDVAVIGAGMAGVLTAFLLGEQGIDCVVLEAAKIGGGQTKGTTAKITSQHGLFYHTLTERYGRERARQYADASEEAIRQYRRIVKERQIECDFEEQSAYLYDLYDAETLRREASAAEALGLPASFAETVELPFPVAGAVRFERQAQFHPLKFLAAVSEGLTIYEHSRVLSADAHMLQVNGYTVAADRIVFATHFPFVNFPGLYFARMHQSRAYSVALENAPKLNGMYVDAVEDGLSLRNYEDLLILCGCDHRTGENTEGGRYGALRGIGRTLFPESRETAHWSAQDCMTPDRVPYIGRYGCGKPGWYVAAGFNKWGMTGSMTAAMILSDLIAGKENPNAAAFRPRRCSAAMAAGVLRACKQAAKGLGRQNLTMPEAAFDDLPIGHGGIVRVGDEKVGVYKDRQGKAHLVDPRCPHMGCQLEWNPDEKSWDCPCHGSRFDCDGRLLDNPAQADLPGDRQE